MHAIYVPELDKIVHLDGALRLLAQMILQGRRTTHIKDCGKVGFRGKIFRTDEPIEKDAFGTVVLAFFVWNEDVKNYFQLGWRHGLGLFPTQGAFYGRQRTEGRHARDAIQTCDHKWAIWVAAIVLLFWIISTQITIFVVQPIGAIPEGKTLIITRYGALKFIDSADAVCQRKGDGVSLICRAVVLGQVANNSTILLRLPYSETLYLLSTNGKSYDR